MVLKRLNIRVEFTVMVVDDYNAGIQRHTEVAEGAQEEGGGKYPKTAATSVSKP